MSLPIVEKSERCWFFHEWTRWKLVPVPGILARRGDSPELQERVCLRCGRRQQASL